MAKLKVNLTPAIGKLQIITKRIVSTAVLGNYKSVFKGRGLEFAQYREYADSDDASMIDWKASTRTNQILVKEFEEERNLNVFILIDTSASMVFGSIKKLKNEYTAELGAAIAHTILTSGDNLGFGMFSDEVFYHLDPKAGTKQFYIFAKEIVETKNYGGKCDIDKAFQFLSQHIPKGSVVILISDFIGIKDNWKKSLKIASSQFDLVGIMVRDPRDKILPNIKANLIFEDPFSDEQVIVNVQEVREDYRRQVARQEKAIKEEFIRARAGFLSLTTDKPFIKPITDFFMMREKMMR